MDIKEEIKRLEAAWDKAFLKGDTDRMEAILETIKELKIELWKN